METVALYVRIPAPLRDRLREHAQSSGATLNALVVAALVAASDQLDQLDRARARARRRRK